jgi:hypothetical protein
VATQSLKPNNQVHKIKLNEDTAKLEAMVGDELLFFDIDIQSTVYNSE